MRPSPPPEVRPLPWREAERIGVGGYPQTPTKEGCALSGLSRRMGANRDWGGGGCTPQHPYQRGLRPLWTLPPDGSEQRLGVYPQHPYQRGLRPLWTLPPDGSEQRLGVYPQHPLPKRAAPSLDSPAGWERTEIGGCTPNTPAKEGCALSGLSCRAGSSSRGSGPDAESGRVRCFAIHFSLINEQLLESLSKDCWLQRDNFKCKACVPPLPCQTGPPLWKPRQ